MKLYTFTGETPSEALKKAQNACGKDALVVNTKMIRKKTLTQDALYEVVVAVEDTQDIKEHQATLTKSKVKSIKNEVETITKIDSLSFDMEKESEESKEIKELKKSLNSVNSRMLELQKLLLETHTKGEFIVPPEFMSIYQKLKKSGMESFDIKEIVGESMKYMPPYMKTNDEMIQRYFSVLLKKIIPVRKETPLKKQKIMMFVGSTGVGKTTTLAKLAARYSILEYNYKVGIITLDTYRIGAVEQLYQYAKMMKLPIMDVIGESDFKKAIQRYEDKDLILIDTVGSSQYDKEKLKNLKRYIEATDIKVDINLVVQANAKLEDLVDIYDSFKFLGIDTMTITKFDETKSFGTIFSLIKKINVPLRYFSVGQEVPDDLRLASSEFLVDCVLEGFRR